MKAQVVIDPNRVLKLLLVTIGFLFIGHILYLISNFVYGYSYRQLFSLFDFNTEGNIATLYAVFAIVSAGLLLLFIGFLKRSHKDKFYLNWLFLGFVFLFIAYDEAAKVHEKLSGIMREYIPEESANGVLHFAWVIPYGLITLGIGILFLRFLRSLPKKTSLLFTIAGGIFVTGAIGFEIFGGHFYTEENTLMYHMTFTVEEILEKLGIALFIYALLDYLKLYIGEEIHIKAVTPQVAQMHKTHHHNDGEKVYDKESNELRIKQAGR